MLDVLFELLFEFFGELILQLVFELFGSAFQAGWRAITRPGQARSVRHEVLWAVMTGMVAGLATVWLFPVLAIRVPWLQLLNLVLAPALAGVLVERIRAVRDGRRGFSFPVFAYAALFGLMFALTRWLLGR